MTGSQTFLNIYRGCTLHRFIWQSVLRTGIARDLCPHSLSTKMMCKPHASWVCITPQLGQCCCKREMNSEAFREEEEVRPRKRQDKRMTRWIRLWNIEVSKRVKIGTWVKLYVRALQQLIRHIQSIFIPDHFILLIFLNQCKD